MDKGKMKEIGKEREGDTKCEEGKERMIIWE